MIFQHDLIFLINQLFSMGNYVSKLPLYYGTVPMYLQQYRNTLAASTQIKEIFRNAKTFQILFLLKK